MRELAHARPRRSSSTSATVSARHSTTISLPTSPDRRAVGIVDETQHAGVDEAGRRCGTRAAPVSASTLGHRDAGPFERLEQRIGEPLRELVERHQPAVGPSPPACGMAPDVAERDAAERRAGHAPDRAEAVEQRARRIAGAEQPSGRGRSRIEQRAGTRRRRRRRRAALRARRRAVAAAPRGPRGRRADCRRSPGTSARDRRGVDVGQRPRHRRATARAGVDENAPSTKRESSRRRGLPSARSRRPSPARGSATPARRRRPAAR